MNKNGLNVLGSIKQKNKRLVVVLECRCGKSFALDRSNVTKATSCGCENRNLKIKDISSNPVLKKMYRAWMDMKQRCSNPLNKIYYRYGQRGIFYDPRWVYFDVFVADVGFPDSKNLSLDRIDNEKSYFKSNVRWTDQKTQKRNTSRIRYIEIFGERLAVWEAAEKYQVKRPCLSTCIHQGRDPETYIKKHSPIYNNDHETRHGS